MSKKQKINLNTTPNSVQVNTYGKHAATSSNYERGGKKAGGRYGGCNQGGRGAYVGCGRGSMNQSGHSDRNSVNQYRDTRVLAPRQKVCGMFRQTSTGQELVYITTSAKESEDSQGDSSLLDFLDE